ncbi:MAG TPA: hypothetical protein VN688_13990 [Gemmataceae bacterium]|nr:hypothetical protein [Gemmataceae bacterium]
MARLTFLAAMSGLILASHLEAAKENGDDLKAALDKSARGLRGYAFRVEEGPGAGAAQIVAGKFQKGRPLFAQAGGIDFFKKGDILVYCQGEQWMRTRRGRESDPLRILAASAAVSRLRPPHEELTALVKGLDEIKKIEEKDRVVYTGTLGEEAARKLAPSEVRNITRGGTARLWTEGGGIVKYRFTLQVKGRQGNAEVDGTRTKTVQLSGLSKTKVEVPAAVSKLLE